MVPLDRDEFRRWREQASTALDTAALASQGGRPEWACFLSEQAAQLALKALLHGAGLQAWGHDLTVLSARATDGLGELWGPDLREATARLSRHYIPTRYPDAHPTGTPGAHYTDADARQAAEDARRLLGAVDATWEALQEADS